MNAAGARNRRQRDARRPVERVARRSRRPTPLPRAPSLAEYAAGAASARTHVMIDRRGNVSTVEVDPARFAAALARFDTHPHDDDADDDDDPDEDLDEIDNAADIDADGPADDDCPICRALRVSAIGPPSRGWSLDG